MNRIATFSTAPAMLLDVFAAQRSLSDVQRQIASGKRLQKGSDGPAEVVTTLDHRARLARSEQLERNADQARQWLGGADLATQTVIGRLTEVRSLLVQARSGAVDDRGREAIANQIRDIRTSLLESANTMVMGRPLFGGTTSGDQAYDASGAYIGDTGEVTMPVSVGVTMSVSRTGPQVFGTHDPLDPMAGDLFQQLDALATAVAANDGATVGAGVTVLDTAMDRVEVIQVELGARMVQIDDLRSSAAVIDDQLRSAVSELEDVDLAEAAIQLKSREAAYQAALAVTARVVQQSLLDFLR
jgi:flagellar hook-associated protein 3 FlgL